MFDGPNEWSRRAVLLAEVLQIYEQSLCPDCAQHSLLAFDPMNTGHFRVDDSTVCLGCETLQRYQERADDMWPGTKVFVSTDIGG